jgi:hypothetical protein
MATTLHIGKKRVQVLTTSDGSTIPPGTVVMGGGGPAVSMVVDPVTNNVTLTGVSAGTVSIAYQAPGYLQVGQQITVVPLPNLIVTDGPEVLV